MIKKTRFILVGGYTGKAQDAGASYYRAITAPYGPQVSVLVCAFARDSEAWSSILADEQEQFARHLPELTVDITLASPTEFLNQVSSKDILIFRGGDTEKLMDKLNKFPDWYKDLSGKTIAASSAGAYVLASLYVQLGREPEIRRGIGLINALVVAHYHSSSFPRENAYGSLEVYWNKVDQLISNSEQTNQIRLPEGEWMLIES